jgi:hypothetical protein
MLLRLIAICFGRWIYRDERRRALKKYWAAGTRRDESLALAEMRRYGLRTD